MERSVARRAPSGRDLPLLHFLRLACGCAHFVAPFVLPPLFAALADCACDLASSVLPSPPRARGWAPLPGCRTWIHQPVPARTSTPPPTHPPFEWILWRRGARLCFRAGAPCHRMMPMMDRLFPSGMASWSMPWALSSSPRVWAWSRLSVRPLPLPDPSPPPPAPLCRGTRRGHLTLALLPRFHTVAGSVPAILGIAPSVCTFFRMLEPIGGLGLPVLNEPPHSRRVEPCITGEHPDPKLGRRLCIPIHLANVARPRPLVRRTRSANRHSSRPSSGAATWGLHP